MELTRSRKDPKVDAYIEKSADFAKPILRHLRKVVHEACPEVEEAMKWSVPHFLYRGMLCSMAAFQAHCAFGFWKGELVVPGGGVRDAAGHLGRIASIRDLPSERTLKGYVRKAVRLNEEGVKAPRARETVDKAVDVPAELGAALKKNRKARATFDGFSHTNKKDYVDWVVEAKTEETRKRRIATAMEWLSEGKVRNWKYVRR